jgi:hypothetical protein
VPKKLKGEIHGNEKTGNNFHNGARSAVFLKLVSNILGCGKTSI